MIFSQVPTAELAEMERHSQYINAMYYACGTMMVCFMFKERRAVSGCVNSWSYCAQGVATKQHPHDEIPYTHLDAAFTFVHLMCGILIYAYIIGKNGGYSKSGLPILYHRDGDALQV